MIDRKYGWRPQRPDFRDRTFAIAPIETLPASADLRPGMPPVWDQGTLGSCTAFASCAAFAYDETRQKLTPFEPSQLFQYFSERQRDSDIDRDGGSTIRTAVKSLAGTGVPRIDLWPYDTSKFAQTPPAEAYTDALLHKATEYVSIPQVEYNIKHAIAGSFPVIFGATIYQSFESGSVAKTGIVPMPQLSESVCGGHALLICGFSDDVELIPGIKGWFTVRNSWGPDFGDAGYVYFPYGYVTNPGLASDFWCVTGIERS